MALPARSVDPAGPGQGEACIMSTTRTSLHDRTGDAQQKAGHSRATGVTNCDSVAFGLQHVAHMRLQCQAPANSRRLCSNDASPLPLPSTPWTLFLNTCKDAGSHSRSARSMQCADSMHPGFRRLTQDRAQLKAVEDLPAWCCAFAACPWAGHVSYTCASEVCGVNSVGLSS